MRWFLAGLAFASVVGLAVATAAIESHNIKQRRRIQAIADEVEASRIAIVTQRIRLREATGLRQLVEHWLRIQDEFKRRPRT